MIIQACLIPLLKFFLEDRLSKMFLRDIPVEAFLCTIAPKNSRLDEWQGLILAVALEHFRLFSDQGRAISAVNAFRYIIADKNSQKASETTAKIEAGLSSTRLSLEQIVSQVSDYLADADTTDDVKKPDISNTPNFI